ncbi:MULTISPECIES: hypothetical protein [unclassified Streptomyces]|uniref:hypothetical protein n=1 Tax=unclassified Streptomyces TaxID=2593676 RepID=UPI00380E91CF
MQGIRSRILRMIEEIDQNPDLELIDSEVAAPASEADLAQARRLAHGELPAGLADFYQEVGSLRLEWRHTVADLRKGDLSDQGFINILPVTKVFGDWEGITYFPGQNEDFRAVKPFDMFVPEACAAFLQKPGGEPGDTVSYHYFGEELCDTRFTFAEYVERLLAARGYWYWLQTLCPGAEETSEVVAFRAKMPRLFRDYDDSLFHPRSGG